MYLFASKFQSVSQDTALTRTVLPIVAESSDSSGFLQPGPESLEGVFEPSQVIAVASAGDFAPRLTSYQTVTKTVRETRARERKQELKVRKEQDENVRLKFDKSLWREVLSIKPCRVRVEKLRVRPGARVKVTTGQKKPVTQTRQSSKSKRRSGRRRKQDMDVDEFTSEGGESDEEEPIFPRRR